jgi:hypothetical protein
MLAADPADRPSTTEVRDTLAALVAGRGGDTTTVLLARTDLRSAAAGRTPTQVSPPEEQLETPPVPARSARAAAVPPVPPSTVTPPRAVAPAPVDTPELEAAAPPAPVVDTGPRRRRRAPAVWLVAGLVAVLLAGLIAFLVIRGGKGSPTAAGAGTSSAHASTSAPVASPSGSSGAASGSGGAPSSSLSSSTSPSATAPATGGGSLTASNIRSFLTSYHQLVISDPHRAYTETGPSLRAAESEPNYVRFWGQFSDVRISNIQATDGQSTATATLSLVYADGRPTDTGQHRFTFIVRGNRLLLDSDRR